MISVAKALLAGLAILGAAFVVLFAAMFFLLQGFGDHFPPSVILRNATDSPVLFFICDSSNERDCQGRLVKARSTASDYVTGFVDDGKAFSGELIATDEDCVVLARTTFVSDGSDFVVEVGDHVIRARDNISPYGEVYAEGFTQQGFAPYGPCPGVGALGG